MKLSDVVLSIVWCALRSSSAIPNSAVESIGGATRLTHIATTQKIREHIKQKIPETSNHKRKCADGNATFFAVSRPTNNKAAAKKIFAIDAVFCALPSSWENV